MLCRLTIMQTTRLIRFSAILLASSWLALPTAMAGPYDDQRMVIVTTDGQLMRDVPEYGSIRIVIDTQGRRLVIDQWNTVIGFEVPAGQVQPGFERDQRRIEQLPYPEPPLPPRRSFPRDDFATAYPDARIERRDLNPSTGTVPSRPRIIEAPSIETPPATTAEPAPKAPSLTKAEVAALQVYLDRNGAAPGVIDGRMGSNVAKAMEAYYEATGERIDPAKTDLILSRLAATGGLAFTSYTITAEDAAGPFIASVPSDYSDKARLERLAFTSTAEMLAERFHMDEAYLRELNPGADFTRPGVQIKVAAPGEKKTGIVTRIVADKARKQVRGYDANGELLVAYPATIGSASTPSPSGEVIIERVVRNPGYTYNPKINFKQGNNDRVLELPPGPNGPVGSIWIALSKPTYGIHGTPEPSKIGKTSSNGCVRLTNWDAEELAGMVAPGVTVSFVE